jgi:hypothetical protein
LIQIVISEHNGRMSSENQAANRPLVGVLSLGCLVAAGVLWWQDPDWGGAEGAIGALIRVGIVMGVLWFALPGRLGTPIGSKISPKVFVFTLGGIALVAARPRIIVMLIPLLAVLGIAALILKPRSSQR